MNFQYNLCLVTDRKIMSTKTLSQAVEQAIIGGCTMVQLREKDVSTNKYYYIAKLIKKITDKYNVPLIINDRIDVALSVRATGVHLGQSDMPASVARQIIGDKMILGVSASSKLEALNASRDGADYIGVGAMFPTSTKTDATTVSIEKLKEIRNSVDIPIIAIGGINKNNASVIRKNGADGLAVVSAILGEKDITTAARNIKEEFLKE